MRRIIPLLMIGSLFCHSAKAEVFAGLGLHSAQLYSRIFSPTAYNNWHQSFAYQFELGWQFNPQWSMALRHTEFGDQQVGNFLSFAINSTALVHRYDFMPQSNWDLYSLIGFNRLYEVIYNPEIQLRRQPRFNPFWGIGSAWPLGAYQRLGVELNIYSARALSFGLNYQFGSLKAQPENQSPK